MICLCMHFCGTIVASLMSNFVAHTLISLDIFDSVHAACATCSLHVRYLFATSFACLDVSAVHAGLFAAASSAINPDIAPIPRSSKQKSILIARGEANVVLCVV